jgi:vitamin B12 transporter
MSTSIFQRALRVRAAHLSRPSHLSSPSPSLPSLRRRVIGWSGFFALTVSALPLAHAADDLSPQTPQQLSTEPALANVAVTADAQHLPQSFDQRYATTQVLTRADLDRLSPIDGSITQALATLPGVTISQNGGPGASASVSIRGSSASQVAVFIDGIRIGSATTGQAAWADLPAAAFDRVEVISGPAAASFGAAAMGGVVQLFTRRASNQPNTTTISTGGG